MIHQERERKACLELREGDYISCFWCYQVSAAFHPPCGRDVLISLFRRAGDPLDTWQIVQRHRYSAPGDERSVRWPSRDRLSAHYYQAKGDEVSIAASCFKIAKMTAAMAGAVFDESCIFQVHGDTDKLTRLLVSGKGPRWFHSQTL